MADNMPLSKNISFLNSLNEDQLKEILRIEMISNETNVDLIKNTVSVLNEKLDQNSDCDVDAAWDKFVNDYSPSAAVHTINPQFDCTDSEKSIPRKKLKTVFRTAIAAALVLTLFIGSAYASGFNLFKAVAEWTSEVFSFVNPQVHENSEPVDTPKLEDIITTDLKSTLDQYGIQEKLIPNYLPDGFEQTEFYVEEVGGVNQFISIYSNGTDSIIIQIKESGASGFLTAYQKDDEDPEIYQVEEISHYIMTNTGNYKAVWVNGNFECSISGLTDKKELTKIIDSIYKE